MAVPPVASGGGYPGSGILRRNVLKTAPFHDMVVQVSRAGGRCGILSGKGRESHYGMAHPIVCMIVIKVRRCAIYLAAIGAVCFYIGRLLPANWFQSDRFPFRCFAIERGGRIYEKLGIRRWKDRVPDMSKILPKVMLPKRLSWGDQPEQVALLIQETCIAEVVHLILFVLGFGCVLLWDGLGGWVVSVVYNLLGNVPFILIQRYNRPRLQRLMAAINAAAERTGEIPCES